MSDGDIRASDDERRAAVDLLSDAVGEGRLTLDEFSDRAETAFASRTRRELEELLLDLHAPAPSPPAVVPIDLPGPATPLPAPSDRNRVVAVMGGAERRGRWRVPAEIQVVAVMGGIRLDLYDAELRSTTVEIRAVAVMGGIEIFVPRNVAVEVDGFVLMGGLEDKTDTPDAGDRDAGPRIRVTGHGLWGGITVGHRDDDRRRALASRPTPPTPPPAPTPTPATPTPAPVPPPTSGPVTPMPTVEPRLDGSTLTLLFTDLVGSTPVAERLGDQRWFGVLRTHNAIVREQLARHEGREIKTQGDGFMVAFTSARRALLAAIDIQRAMAGYRASHPEHDLHVRIGLHTGEVVADDGDVYGRNVILASRIASSAGPDEVLASSLTKQLAEAGGDLGFGPARNLELQGLSGGWDVHPVEWT